MNENEELKIIKELDNLVYTIRGKKVIFDSDVAKLYETDKKIIRKVVKRNIKRFSEDCCFQLTETELQEMKSQFENSSQIFDKYRDNRYLPYVFTDKGIVMLALLLKNKIAVQFSIRIINELISTGNMGINELFK